MTTLLSPAALRIVDWLGEVGPRWGLPADACRVHALLYLKSRPVLSETIGAELAIEGARVDAALAWLGEQRLVDGAPRGWVTKADPWALMIQALDARRAREMTPARAIMRDWQRNQGQDDPIVVRQALRLFELVEDIAAIDAGTRNVSPDTMRRLVGIGGRAARFIDRAFGSGRRA